MKMKERFECQSSIYSEGRLLRGKIPIPVVRRLGGRAGDSIIFRENGAGLMIVSVSRPRGASKNSIRETPGLAARRARK